MFENWQKNYIEFPKSYKDLNYWVNRLVEFGAKDLEVKELTWLFKIEFKLKGKLKGLDFSRKHGIDVYMIY